MPVRMLATMASLLATFVGLLLVAWATGNEIYVFFPSRSGVDPPPTSPLGGLLVFGIVGVVALLSPHYALVTFTIGMAGLPLGTVVGYFVFDWMPTVCQYLLTISYFTVIYYLWRHQDYLDF